MNDLDELIRYAFRAHRDQARTPEKAVRKWDGATPYGIHPVWCAMTILAETSLTNDLRKDGAIALLFHDLLEDTFADLPKDTSTRVRMLVEEMTFESFTAECEKVWIRSPECLLLKLYDKVSNLLDGVWMSSEKRERYLTHTQRLVVEVEQHFGNSLNILRLAHALCE